MKVILKDDVRNLGKMGDIVNVADGHAHNFLIPKGLAVEANMKNVKAFEHEKRVIQERAKKLMKTAQALSDRLSSTTVTLKAKAGEEEKLFGSITTMDIAEALKSEGIEVNRKKIVLEEPIKRLGTHKVIVKLSQDIAASLNVEVVPE